MYATEALRACYTLRKGMTSDSTNTLEGRFREVPKTTLREKKTDDGGYNSEVGFI